VYGVLSLFKRKKEKPEDLLKLIDVNRGLLWEAISDFKESIQSIVG